MHAFASSPTCKLPVTDVPGLLRNFTGYTVPDAGGHNFCNLVHDAVYAVDFEGAGTAPRSDCVHDAGVQGAAIGHYV